MRKKSINYRSADSSGWMHKCDDLFLERYRGKPCIICGKTFTWENGTKTVSCGHHLVFKERARKFRYDPNNIVVLCPFHHSHYNAHISPHSMVNTQAQANFSNFIKDFLPETYDWWQEAQLPKNMKWDQSWTYRDKYVELGGDIVSSTDLVKDLKPKNHAEALRKVKEKYGRN